MPPSSSKVRRLSSKTSAGTTARHCYGLLSGRLVVIGYTARGTVRHMFSMRKANDREKALLAPYFEI